MVTFPTVTVVSASTGSIPEVAVTLVASTITGPVFLVIFDGRGRIVVYWYLPPSRYKNYQHFSVLSFDLPDYT